MFLLFNIFFCFYMFVNKHFAYLKDLKVVQCKIFLYEDKYIARISYLQYCTFHLSRPQTANNIRLRNIWSLKFLLHYLWLADLAKSISLLFVNICQYLSFLNIFFIRFCPAEKCGVSPTLLILWFINLNDST